MYFPLNALILVLCLFLYSNTVNSMPVPVAERSKVHVYGRSLAGIAGSNPTRGMDVCLHCYLILEINIMDFL
jgi:hypothetical protein